VASKKRATADPSASHLPPSVAEKRASAVSVAVVDFLADLRLDGSQRVLGAIAISLAESMEAARLYSQAKFAHELREIVAELRTAETNPRNLSLLKGLRL
jgi:hypothetical protein